MLKALSYRNSQASWPRLHRNGSHQCDSLGSERDDKPGSWLHLGLGKESREAHQAKHTIVYCNIGRMEKKWKLLFRV